MLQNLVQRCRIGLNAVHCRLAIHCYECQVATLAQKIRTVWYINVFRVLVISL